MPLGLLKQKAWVGLFFYEFVVKGINGLYVVFDRGACGRVSGTYFDIVRLDAMKADEIAVMPRVLTFPVTNEEYDRLAELIAAKPDKSTRVTGDYERILGYCDYRVGLILFAVVMKVGVDINPPWKD